MTITITNKPESLSEKSKPRKNKYQFSTEYTQLFKDGINTSLKEYSVSFKDIPSAIETLDTTLESLNSTEAFLWNPFNGVDGTETARSFVCEEWETTYETGGYSTLSATFKQVADKL